MAGLNSQVLHAHSKSSFPVYSTAIALEEEALREMGLIGESMDSIKTLQIRSTLSQAATLGMIVASALMIWKGLICITGSSSPVVVVLSGSMEPGFKRLACKLPFA
ncbi:Signal peptidase complex catalytic subunit SEC11A [Vitis vinifera]|uniref:Signal peptidase complex catalytic subunit SEC11 n=2 Tax=Vitis vinifera TaxID=29760 RepID=A0A438JPR4_VITVI|nr:Signal peptidase complex catalytic subunit SEC11A [Vitis vinifera]